MNWTIDFKGGTEIIFAFKDKATHEYDQGRPRQGPRGARQGRRGRLRRLRRSTGRTTRTSRSTGMIVRTPRFSALKPEVASGKAVTRRSTTKFDKDREIGEGDVVRRPAVRPQHEEADHATSEADAGVRGTRSRRPRAQAVARRGRAAVHARRRGHRRVQRAVRDLGPRSPVREASSRRRSPNTEARWSAATASARRPATSCATTPRSRSSTRSS